MQMSGPGQRVQVFIKEGEYAHGKPLYLAILELLRGEGGAGATVTRGIAGFGSHSKIHNANLIDLAMPLPLVITWVDAPEAVERLLPAICDLVQEGLVTVDDIQIVKHTHPEFGAPSRG